MLINGKRALAHIQQVHDIQPIEGADNIELVHVLGWTLIAKKGEFKDGDLAVYIEIDSKVPDTDDRFAFLQSKKFKVKTYKLGKFGVVSQGLALPLSLFPELSESQLGDDVTDILHITYAVEEDNARKGPRKSNPNDWVKIIAAKHPKFFKSKVGKFLMARKWGRKLVRIIFFFVRPKHNDLDFPSEYCSKTDEERIQNMPYILKDKEPYIVTEKIDGTSTTYVLAKKKGLFGKCTYEFIVSSRNVRQLDPGQVCYHDNNVYWEMAEKYDIKNKMIKMLEHSRGMDYIVIQGETYGESVQGNKYKLNGRYFAAFNVIAGVKGNGSYRMSPTEGVWLLNKYDIPFVPIINDKYILPDTVDEILKDATGISELNNETLREGWVIRRLDDNGHIISFKVVSPEFLMKHKL
jgi:hypothetical protein